MQPALRAGLVDLPQKGIPIKRAFSFKGKRKWIWKRARELRDAPTEAENALHKALTALNDRWWSNRPLIGYDIIADLYYKPARLIVEVDGGYHGTPEQQEKDQRRDELCRKCGFHVLRYTNDEVLRNPKRLAVRIMFIARKLAE